jgi:MFS family permease
LYETALGLGIAVGPLLGGELGGISWRGPFYGVAVLMALALLATAFFVPSIPKPKRPTALSAPLKALRHRGLLTMGLVALLYNWGVFTMLGYAPYPMNLDARQLGLVFTGWGILVAVFAVFVAPRLQGRWGTVRSLSVNMVLLAAAMAAIAAGVNTPVVVIVAVIISGAFIGINNTLTTQAVMLVSPVERSVASSAYGFVRFIGGGLAPFVAGKIASATSLSVPFYLAAVLYLVSLVVLASGYRLITAAETAVEQDEDEVLPTIELALDGGSHSEVVVVAVTARPDAAAIVDQAAVIARTAGAALDVVQVRETRVLSEFAFEAEDEPTTRARLRAYLDRLEAAGIAATGHVLHSVGDHAAAGRALARHANALDARAVVVGPSVYGSAFQFADGSLTTALTNAAKVPVIFVRPGELPQPLAQDTPAQQGASAS